MNNKILTAMFIVLCLAIGYAPLQAGEVSGKSLPVITAAFASKELIPGHTWKVYLKSSDPDGDMQYIVSVVYQPGGGDYPVSRTRIREGNRKELNGFIMNPRNPIAVAFSDEIKSLYPVHRITGISDYECETSWALRSSSFCISSSI